MEERLVFPADGIVLPVEIGNMRYELREMTAAARDQFVDEVRDRMRFDNAGQVVGIKRFEGLQASLISRCLYSDGKLVSITDVQKMPASVVSQLFHRAHKINHLDKDEKELETQVKND